MIDSVAIVRCPDYDPRRVAEAVAEMLSALGGIGSIVGAGDSVLIKPNLLTDAEPERAVTTHPEVVRALIRQCQAGGATVAVGDSPVKAAQLDRVWERTGYRALCEREKAVAMRFEQHPTQPLTCGETVLQVADAVLAADVVINAPKVKTHLLTQMTGAVKNLYGTLPGYQKTLLHRTHATPSDFGRLPAALYARLRPALNVADGIVGMQGAGPSGGDPVSLGFLAASRDAISLDTALCAIMGLDARRLPWAPHLPPDTHARLDPKALTYPLLTPDEVRPPRFRVPSSLWPRFIPGWLTRRWGHHLWIRPDFAPACIRCGRCVKACCNDALSLERDVPHPTLAPARCVACCCCHEACPVQAITMRQSPLLNWIRRGRLP